MTTLKERALWTGTIGSVWGTGSVMGPFAGAVFSEYTSWSWIGYADLPLLGVVVVLISPFLTLQAIKFYMRAKIRHRDWLGISLHRSYGIAWHLSFWAST